MKTLRNCLPLIFFSAVSAYAQTQPLTPPVPPFGLQQVQEAMLRQMQLMATLFDLQTSKLGFEETVTAIRSAAEKRGWKVGEVHDVQAAMKAEGVKDAPRLKVISACPKDANEQLAKASQGKTPPLPCRMTVFETKDGKVQIMRLNTGILAKGMQGEAAKVLAQVAAEEEAVLQGVVQ